MGKWEIATHSLPVLGIDSSLLDASSDLPLYVLVFNLIIAIQGVKVVLPGTLRINGLPDLIESLARDASPNKTELNGC